MAPFVDVVKFWRYTLYVFDPFKCMYRYRGGYSSPLLIISSLLSSSELSPSTKRKKEEKESGRNTFPISTRNGRPQRSTRASERERSILKSQLLQKSERCPNTLHEAPTQKYDLRGLSWCM